MHEPTALLRYTRRRLIAFVAASPVAALLMHTPRANAQPVTRGRLTPFAQHGSGTANAPFGGEVDASITYYNRASPYVATAGLLLDGGLAHAQALGFQTVLDLRGSDEKGVPEEAALAARLEIVRLHLPVTERAPTIEQVSEFAELVQDERHYPMLVHCVSSNRSGALWALYRASVGVDPVAAVEEGRANGLESREAAVRDRLDIG